MCPLCGEHDGQPCPVSEKASGRLVCGCGKHAWPSSAAFLESCRQLSLTITGRTHIWTQGY